MPSLLVSDTSVLIDLDRGNLLQAGFKLPTALAVPDVLYERELKDSNGPVLLTLGLKVLSLDGTGVALAQAYTRKSKSISVPDAFALALAKAGSHVLLSGDKALTKLASDEGVDCHGVLWLLDRIEEAALIALDQLRQGLETLASHPRCRLPRELIEERLVRYRKR
jgi:predicted nucleic acid-binding protein